VQVHCTAHSAACFTIKQLCMLYALVHNDDVSETRSSSAAAAYYKAIA
jgi:hypothetical protein